MLCDYVLIDYIVVPKQDVSQKLKEGYLLYGAVQYNLKKGLFEQALVKKNKIQYIDLEFDSRLTAREIECLKYYFNGKETEDIAKLLKVKKSTVKRHLANIREKCGCKNNRELINVFKNNG